MAQFLFTYRPTGLPGLRWFSGVALLSLAGCAAGPADIRTPQAPEINILAGNSVPEDAVALEYHILAGELAVQRGNRDVAAREYVAALEFSSNPELAQRAARVALFAGKPDLAYKAASAWAAASPGDADAHKTAARLALRVGDVDGLATHANGILNQHSSGVAEGFRVLPEVLTGEPEQANIALQVMGEQVNAHPQVPEAHYALGLLALRYERMEIADRAVQQALALKPEWGDAALLRAGILVRQGRVDEAITLVDDLDGSNAERAEYHLGFARLLLDANQTAAAADQFERVLSLEPKHSDARYGLGLLTLSLEQTDRAEKAFETLYESGQRRHDAAYYLGNIAASRENYSEARDWYQRVDTGSHAFDARLLAARALYKSGDLPGAREELRELRSANPSLSDRLYMSEAELLFDAERYQDALEIYNQALDDSPNDSDLLYGRSLVHERLGRFDQAEQDLQAILERDPDDARALNALGYMLTNHSQRYQQALEYIEQALAAEPEDPAVIDSMGWVQYRLGNLEAAREHLQRAYEMFPDPEVAAHLGEVLWQLGKQERARRIWDEALAKNPGNATVRDTIDRLVR